MTERVHTYMICRECKEGVRASRHSSDDCATIKRLKTTPPGQVAVLLDEDDVNALDVVDGLLRASRSIDNDAAAPRAIRAILERAREASR